MPAGLSIRKANHKAFNKIRRLLYGDIVLKFFEKKTGDAILLTQITDGWLPDEERIRGQIETLFKVEVIDQEKMTADVTSRVNRLQWGTNYCKVDSQDPPQGEPRIWTFFTKEIKTGAIK